MSNKPLPEEKKAVKEKPKTIREKLESFRGKTSDATIFEASQVVRFYPLKIHDAYLEGEDILLEGGGKGIITVKYRE